MSVITIDVPESLYGKLKEAAGKNNRTPEHFVVLAIAEKLARFAPVDYLEKRTNRLKPNRFEELLSKIPDEEPEENDKL